MVEVLRREQTLKILAQEKFFTFGHTYFKLDALIKGEKSTIFSYYPMAPKRLAEHAAAIDHAKSLLIDEATKEYAKQQTDAFFNQISSGGNYRTKPVLQNDKFGELTPLIRQNAYEQLYTQWIKYWRYSSARDEES